MTDRGLWVAGRRLWLNVRRLMYQMLICAWLCRRMLRDEPGCVGTPLNPEGGQRLAYPLIDRMGRNVQLRSDLFGTQMLIDQT
jgi:hypothetical protein